ncbi:hypothetical protein SynROS8604_00242 [Synechococcus sp. ROS8604]|nr:hypothetical protein SynROS8604_00242 [Synechococcus sp. ROS8604]
MFLKKREDVLNVDIDVFRGFTFRNVGSGITGKVTFLLDEVVRAILRLATF